MYVLEKFLPLPFVSFFKSIKIGKSVDARSILNPSSTSSLSLLSNSDTTSRLDEPTDTGQGN